MTLLEAGTETVSQNGLLFSLSPASRCKLRYTSDPCSAAGAGPGQCISTIAVHLLLLHQDVLLILEAEKPL